jgi:long-chain acyl-CoA synthetase
LELTASGDLVSIPHLLLRNAQKFGDRPAYREKEFGIWQSWTWLETAEEIEALALGLIDIGVKKGDYVAIIGRNRPSMYWSMVAVQMLNAVPVPLYQDAVAEEMAYVLEHCGSKYVIVGDQEQVDKVREVQETVSGIENVIYFDPRGLRKYDHKNLSSFKDLQKQGRRVKDQSRLKL